MATSVSVLGMVAAGAGVGLVIRSLSATIIRPDIAYRALSASGLDLPFALAHAGAAPPDFLGQLQDAVRRAWSAA